MRAIDLQKALEIRWHETKPIFSADFQPFPTQDYVKHAHPMGESPSAAQTHKNEGKQWRLATAGGDNHVRVWLVTPTPITPSTTSQSPIKGKEVSQQPTVEYLATLSRHSAVVNVVRWSPSGNTLATAGDDGSLILWTKSENAAASTQTGAFGESNEDALYAREGYKIRRSIRVTQQEIYDISWSPDGQWLLIGSTDNTARVVSAVDGTIVQQITDHSNYVQGVAWDPLNKYIATQSSDRHMHVYGIDIRQHASGKSEVAINLLGKNSKMDVVQHRRTSSSTDRESASTSKSTSKQEPEFRPPAPKRSMSTMSRASDSSDTSMTPSTSRQTIEVPDSATSASHSVLAPSGDTEMPPPTPSAPSSSRRSSLSGSQTAASPPSQSTNLPGSGSMRSIRGARSPSPMPPLPAIRMPTNTMSPNLSSSNTGLKDVSASTSTLPPPADQAKSQAQWLYGGQEISPFFRRLSWSTDGSLLLTPAGLFEDPFATATATSEIEKEKSNGDESSKKENGGKSKKKDKKARESGPKPTVYIYSRANVTRPPVAHLPGHKSGSISIRFNPLLFELRGNQSSTKEAVSIDITERTEASVDLKDPTVPNTSIAARGTFDLPHRMVYAVATHESVYVYDTQQPGPICMFGNLHYAPFTDVAWTADGLTLVLASQDGYCSVVAFEVGELGTPLPPYEQPVRPNPSGDTVLQSTNTTSSSLPPTPSSSTLAATPSLKKHSLEQSTPLSSEPNVAQPDGPSNPKKRRVALTTIAKPDVSSDNNPL